MGCEEWMTPDQAARYLNCTSTKAFQIRKAPDANIGGFLSAVDYLRSEKIVVIRPITRLDFIHLVRKKG